MAVLQSNFYQTQANIQYSFAQRALNSGDTAAAKNYNRKGDEYQQLVYVHQQKEAAAAAASREAAERAKWENIQGYGDTAASKEYLAQKAAAAALAKTESDRAALMYLGTGVTDVQTMNSSIATQSAVAAATLAVNNAQAPDPGAAGTVSQLALQTQAQDYIDSAPNYPVAGPMPTYQNVMGATQGATLAASAASANAGPGPQLQDVINAQNGGPMQPQTVFVAPKPKGINPIFIGLGIVGVAVVARAVMR